MSMKRSITGLLALAMLGTACAAQAGGYYRFGYHGYHHGHHGGDGAALAAGLILGGLIGWAVSEDRYRSREYVYRDRYYAAPPQHVHTHAVYRPGYTTVPAQYRVADPGSEFAGHNCRMTREYTTTIDIDGQPRAAYGTRCLTQNGSWVLGRPKLALEFD